MLPQRKNLLRRNAWYRQQLLLNNMGTVTADPDAVRGSEHFGRSPEVEPNEASSCTASPSSMDYTTAAPAV